MSKLNPSLVLAAAWLSAGLTVVLAQNPTPLLTQPAGKLVAVLQSQATQKEKADACRELAVIGTREAVPALVALLADEKLHHMARYALETIPDPGVDDALREALGKLKGLQLVGVMGSLGVRHDPKAVKALATALNDADVNVAQAAARALGRIGTTDAAKSIQAALPQVPPTNQLAFCEGLFRCAEAQAAKGQKSEALAIYDKLRALPALPHQVRAGALRGAILTRGKDGLTLMAQAVRGNDYILTAAAARAALEMKGPDVTKTLVAELSSPSLDKQLLIIQTLGKRGDATALPPLFGLAKTGIKSLRVAAIRAVPEIGDPSAVPVLAGLLKDAEPEVTQAAQEALGGFPGREVDAAVATMLGSVDASQRLTAIELIGRRRMDACVPALLKAAGDTDARVRPAALKRLGELGGSAQVPALLERLTRSEETQDLDAAEQALSAICARASSPEDGATKVIAAAGQAQPAQKGALLRVLASIGGGPALQAVRAAVDDSHAEVHGAAIRALGNWKTADAAPALLALAQAATDPTDKMLCLRGYLDWAAHPDLSADQRLGMCQQAAPLLQRPEEKKLLLGALGAISTVGAVAMIAPYLDDAAAKEEAATATVAIADKLLKARDNRQYAAKLVEPLEKAVKATANEDLSRRAQALLQRAQAAGR